MLYALDVKTSYSMLSSLIKINDLTEKAKELGYFSLAITDTNNMFGTYEFYLSCIKKDIKPIVGIKLEYDENKFILLAKNNDGYRNLIKISTLISEGNIDNDILIKYANNLILIMPYSSYNSEIISIYKEYFVGYSNIEERNNIKDKAVFVNDISYLEKDDYKYLDYLIMIKEEKKLGEFELNTFKGKYLFDKDEFELITDDVVRNNMKYISNSCNVTLEYTPDLLPIYDKDINPNEFLRNLAYKGIKRRLNDDVSNKYIERLNYELSVIEKMGFSDYFLVVWDYVKYAKFNNILVGPGRGSAAGSLVSYAIGITDVDPIKYDLLFERFLNPERISMPDIDIDFEHEKREQVINYCINKYGEKRVVPIITFGTLGAKQAIRDVGKTLDIELGLIDTLCKYLDSKISLTENLKNPKIKELLDRKENLRVCYKIAIAFEGLKRHTSIHAAGVVMSNVDLDEVIPLDKSHDFYTSGIDMTYLEELGLLKMDFLAIKYLTTIHNIIDSINKDYNLNISFDTIPLNDTKALSLFNKADTIGIFQFESDGMINFLRKLKVTSMDDLFAAIALFRPGPMQNIPKYIARKNNKEKIDYIIPALEPILKSTYGIIIYQEQIMQIAHVLADYSLGEADILRKAMSKKKLDILLNEKEKFVSRAIKKGYDKNLIEQVYDLMLKFASYGFNKSHSIGYSIVAYKMAYLKAYYPKNFITYLLSMEVNDEVKTKQYIYEAKKNNIQILLPDINKSYKKYVVEDIGIRYPLSSIRNVGLISSEQIIEERKNGLYKDIFDFISRCYSKGINRKVLEALIYSNAFSSFGYNKKTLIENMDAIINYGELIKDLDASFALKPEIEIHPEYTKNELMEQELKVFGLYLTNNPITDLKQKYNNIINLNEIELYFDKNVNIVVIIDKLKEITTAKSDKMCFILGSDELSNVDIVLFPKTYEKYKDLVVGQIIKLSGKVEKRFDKYQVIANEIEKL